MVSVKTKPVNAGEKLTPKKNYNGIDLVKFICSILVFMIHIDTCINRSYTFARAVNYELKQGLCRVAVPFFFVSSGFFLFKKMELHNLKTDVIKKYCFRIFQLLGVWSILLFMGGTLHLWYMGATVVAVVLLCVCLQKLKMRLRYILLMAVLLYTIGLAGGTYSFIFEPLTNIAVFKYPIKFYEIIFTTTRNGVFFGFVFVLMGALFAHREIKLSAAKAFAGFVVSSAGILAEAYLVRDYMGSEGNNMFLSLIPAVFFLFAFAKNVKLKDRPVYRRLRTLGVLIYFLHLFANEITSLLRDIVADLIGFNIRPYSFIITLIITLVLSFLIEWLSRKEKFEWINWLL